MLNKPHKTSFVSAIVLIFAFSISYVFATTWTPPNLPPPSGNVSAPINTSATAQTKTGDFTAGSLTTAGNVTANDIYSTVAGKWMSELGGGTDNLGNHTATMNLNMNGNSISGVNSVTASRFCIGSTCYTSFPPAPPPTLRHYQCPNLQSGCVSSFPCTGNQSSINYCNESIAGSSSWCSGCGCFNQRSVSCTPVWY
ncbi:MAG: hypothetical protein K9M10_02030 [Candidatus Pacebacteria bacterium]|nr:hypothetical protein [Candidatus Paceibacterota bacterium]MCF7857243.1 hypothetical protein [Candidatus Paceibacterota bacterium]